MRYDFSPMGSSDEDVFTEALSLPAGDRARLAKELLASLDQTRDADAAEAWLDEIERRARDVEAGTASLESWAAVRARLAARWRRR